MWPLNENKLRPEDINEVSYRSVDLSIHFTTKIKSVRIGLYVLTRPETDILKMMPVPQSQLTSVNLYAFGQDECCTDFIYSFYMC